MQVAVLGFGTVGRSVYEMLADEKRYSYLLELAKANDLHAIAPIIR